MRCDLRLLRSEACLHSRFRIVLSAAAGSGFTVVATTAGEVCLFFSLIEGYTHFRVARDNSKVVAWGAGKFGSNGCGFRSNVLFPQIVRPQQSPSQSPSSSPSSSPSPSPWVVTQVACGNLHALACTVTGAVYAWGGGTG